MLVRNRGCGELNRGSQNLDSPGKGERIVTFCVVQKVTKKHTGLRPATSIQSSDGNNLREASDGTRRTRLFARNGGEKALNRCDAPVLQRKELERTSKEQPYSLRTVGYGWVGMENGVWKKSCFGGRYRKACVILEAFCLKKAVFEGNKQRLV